MWLDAIPVGIFLILFWPSVCGIVCGILGGYPDGNFDRSEDSEAEVG